MFYALAKLFEFYDRAIYSANGILSGHTIKHFAAAAACGALLRYFQKRQPITIRSAAHRPQELRLRKKLGSRVSFLIFCDKGYLPFPDDVNVIISRRIMNVIIGLHSTTPVA